MWQSQRLKSMAVSFHPVHVNQRKLNFQQFEQDVCLKVININI